MILGNLSVLVCQRQISGAAIDDLLHAMFLALTLARSQCTSWVVQQSRIIDK